MIGAERLDDDQRKAISLAEKMLRLAKKNPNPEEAAVALKKANELLIQHNLDMAAVEACGEGEDGARMEGKLEGGFYEYQRNLWEAVADLNFCVYWNQMSLIETKQFRPSVDKLRFVEHIDRRYANQHHLVGRRVNVVSTRAMAGYLEAAIERMVEKHIQTNEEGKRSKWANSFREGITATLLRKIGERQREIMTQAERETAEAAERAAQALQDGASTETGVTLANYKASEDQSNYDFIYGAGAWAQNAIRRQERAESLRRAQEEHTKWCEDNPEEARKQYEEELKRERRNAARRTGRNNYRDDFRGDRQAFAAGRRAGDEIGIDPQADTSRRGQRRVRHG